jgi:UDP-glucose 4-epimerase
VKVLVTGGAGFIGSHIVDKLIEKNIAVTVIDNLSSGTIENVNKKAEFIQKDIRSNDLTDIFRDAQFDYVIHQAAQTMVTMSFDDPKHDCEVNILGTINVLDACRKSRVRRIVFASSAAVYGDISVLPTRVDTLAQPTSFYGISKLTAEKYMRLYSRAYDLEFVALRYANVYGERQGDRGEGGVISIFLKRAFESKPLTVYGDGSQTRDFIYVGDVAEANIKAIEITRPNSIYNVSTCTEISINSLISQIEQVTGNKMDVNYSLPRKGDIFRSLLENRETVHELVWQPKTRLLEGLQKTYQSFYPK